MPDLSRISNKALQNKVTSQERSLNRYKKSAGGGNRKHNPQIQMRAMGGALLSGLLGKFIPDPLDLETRTGGMITGKLVVGLSLVGAGMLGGRKMKWLQQVGDFGVGPACVGLDHLTSNLL